MRQETTPATPAVATTETAQRSELLPSDAGLTPDVIRLGQTYDPMTGNPTSIFGVSAEFTSAEAVLAAAQQVRAEGYRKVDAYTPMPVEGLTDVLGWRDKLVPFLMLCGGFVGFFSALTLQYSGMAWFYPLNVGGKPLNSWPMYVVPCFEMTVLFTALTGVVSMIVLNGLPQLYHPMFSVPGFERASNDRFFLCIESEDPKFDRDGTLQFMRSLGAVRVAEVER
jgi:hypothetical protein